MIVLNLITDMVSKTNLMGTHDKRKQNDWIKICKSDIVN